MLKCVIAEKSVTLATANLSVPSLSRGGLGWGWVKTYGIKPIPIPTFPLKGKEPVLCDRRLNFRLMSKGCSSAEFWNYCVLDFAMLFHLERGDGLEKPHNLVANAHCL